MSIIDETVQDYLKKITSNRTQETTTNPVSLYFKNTMSTNYKQDEKQLKTIIKKNIETTQPSQHLKIIIYYKSKKLHSQFIKNNIHSSNTEIAKRHHVVYRYTCSRDGCHTAPQTYIGYTTCTISDRFRMHTQNSSSIKKHLQDYHQVSRTTTAELLQNVDILYTSSSKRDLVLIEAIYIKKLHPALNSQNEGCDRILKIFKH